MPVQATKQRLEFKGTQETEKTESLEKRKEKTAPPVGATTTPVIPKRAIYHICLLPDPAADGSNFDRIHILAVIFAISFCLHLFVFSCLYSIES